MPEFFRLELLPDPTGGTVDGLIRAFSKLPGNLGKKHLGAAMRRSVKPFMPALRKATPVDSGNLRRSVKTIVRVYGSVAWYTAVGVVGYSRNNANPKKRGSHSHLVERGTGERRRKNGQVTGRAPSRWMLRETLRSLSGPILGNLTREMAVSLERAASELAREQARGRFKGY